LVVVYVHDGGVPFDALLKSPQKRSRKVPAPPKEEEEEEAEVDSRMEVGSSWSNCVIP